LFFLTGRFLGPATARASLQRQQHLADATTPCTMLPMPLLLCDSGIGVLQLLEAESRMFDQQTMR